MAKGLQQPCFVENMGGIDEDAPHQLQLLKYNLHHFQMLRMCIWNMATHCQMFMLHSLWLEKHKLWLGDLKITCLYVGDFLLLLMACMWIR